LDKLLKFFSSIVQALKRSEEPMLEEWWWRKDLDPVSR
jgi:hypothetical protein